MKEVTLSQIIDWLESLPVEDVVYFDSLEPRHGLMAAYLTVQGHQGVTSEYDKAKSGSKTTIATYSEDLTRFIFGIHYHSIRYIPTPGSLLDYAQHGDWQEFPLQSSRNVSFYETSPEAFNSIYDSALRPESVEWKHVDMVSFRGNEYRVTISVSTSSDTYTPDPIHSLPYLFYIRCAQPNDDISWLTLKHYHADGRIGQGISHQPYNGYGYQFSLSSLADGEYVELYHFGSHDVFGVWQSRDSKLFLAREGVPVRM